MLELKDASFAIGGRLLFRKLSLMALGGQFTCITGTSGVGKTMMLRVMMGFETLDEGLVSINGELLTPLSAPTFRRLMAYVPQRQNVELEPSTMNDAGLEFVWAPYHSKPYALTAIDEYLPVASLATKPIVLADDPELSMLSTLKSLADDGHTVVVASEREDYIRVADKLVILEKS